MNNAVHLHTALSLLALAGCVDLEAAEDSYEHATSELAIPPCASGTWCIEPSPAGAATVHDVWAAGADDVFAVGDGGLIMRRQADEWVAMDSGTTQSLRAVHGSSASNVWAVGQNGAVVRFDGSAWSPVAVATSGIDAVWLADANHVFLSGGSSVWRSSNGGASFTRHNLTGSLFSISGASATEVYVTGENSYVRKWNGSTWSTINPGAGTTTYFSVLALGTNDVWVSDFIPGKETMHLAGKKWAAKGTSQAVFQDLHHTSASDLWGVGGSKVGRFDGSSWTVTAPLGAGASLWGVHGAPGHVWAVGANGLVAHYAY